MKAPGLTPALDRPPGQSETQQLPPRHDPVLPRGHLRHAGIDWAASGTYLMFKLAQSIHTPMIARETARDTTRL